MSASEDDQRGPARKEATRFRGGLSLAVLVGFGAINLFLLVFIVPKFEMIYADALPGRPLPEITEFILSYRYALAFVALGWPVGCAILRQLRKPYAILVINIGLIWFVLEIGITVVALFMPMDGIITGMSDTPLKPGS